MTPSENDTLTRAFRVAIIDDQVAGSNALIDPSRWAALDDRERMRRIGAARAARAVLGHVARIALADVRDTAEEREARRARRRPVLSLVEGGRVVGPHELAARERGDDAPPAPRLLLVP